MVEISDSLTWELVKGNTSFMKKRNGRTKRSGAMRFSVEPGNLMNLSTYKYSGLANSKAIDISPTESESGGVGGGGAELKKKTVKASVYPARGMATTPLNKNYRKVQRSLTSQVVDNYYRRDLKKATLARWSAVYRSNRISQGLKKKVAVKKGRKN